MVSGPEISRIINDFELSQELVRNIVKQEEQIEQEDLRYYEQIKEVQNTFWNQVNNVVASLKKRETPLADRTGDLLVPDTHDIVDSKVVETDRTVEQLGKDQYQQFVTKRLQERTTPLFDTVQKTSCTI